MRRRAVTPPGTAAPRLAHLQPTIPPPRDWRYVAGWAGQMVELTGLLPGDRRGPDARCFARRSWRRRRSAKPGSPTSGLGLWLTHLCPRTALYVSCATRGAVSSSLVAGCFSRGSVTYDTRFIALRIFWVFAQRMSGSGRNSPVLRAHHYA